MYFMYCILTTVMHRRFLGRRLYDQIYVLGTVCANTPGETKAILSTCNFTVIAMYFVKAIDLDELEKFKNIETKKKKTDVFLLLELFFTEVIKILCAIYWFT